MKKQKKRSIAKDIAFSAILCALGTVLLFLGSILEIIDITMAALASFLIVISMIEIGGYMPYLVFGCTSVLSFLLLPNKSAALFYVLFFGFYPILKRFLEKPKPFFSWVIKLVFFNISLCIYYILAKFVIITDLGNMEILMFFLMNFIFVTFDIALTLFVTAYVRKYRKVLRLDKFFK